MSEHRFQMRLSCRYEQPDNTVAELGVENLVEGEWEDFQLGFKSPGFLIFVYGILNCQHLYMRTNAAERGFALESASGSIEVTASEDWVLEQLNVHFDARLQSGAPTAEDVDYIVDRMRHCPVSINLKDVADSRTTLTFA